LFSGYQRFGIIQYVRYADNLAFLLQPTFDRIKKLRDFLESECMPYTATVEVCSPDSMVFLDMEIYRERATGRLAAAPFLKPTALSIVLRASSAHPVSVHRSWVHSYFRRMRAISTHLSVFRDFKAECVNRMLVGGLDRPLVCAADTATAYFEAIPTDILVGSRPIISERVKFWVPVDYHPFLYRPITRALRRITDDSMTMGEIEPLFAQVDLRPAWRVASLPFSSLVRRY